MAPEKKSEQQESVQQDVESKAEDEAAKQRRKLVEEAISAVQMTKNALTHLSEETPKTDEALAELEKAIGKLELLVARNPDLATIPVAVDNRMYDVLAKTETVKKLIDEAEEALEDGLVQDARRILSNLASEFVVSVTRLPLATYPVAIKAAVPLIDQGKIDEAKAQIQTALNLLVVHDTIYPLPLMRAESMLAKAEKLSEKSDRKESENKELAELLDAARDEIKFGQVLGYYDSDAADPLYEQIKKIESKTKGGKSGKGLFDKLKQMISDLF